MSGPDWSATAGGMEATATYLPSSGEFEVVVSLGGRVLREKVPASYEPRFGVDVDFLARWMKPSVFKIERVDAPGLLA